MANRYHRVEWGPEGTRSRTKTWNQPPKWNREAAKAGEVRKVFCASLADIFEDKREILPWRDELFDLIDKCPSLNWLLLTKRPENIRKFWPVTTPQLRENVWLGTSIAHQPDVDDYIPALLEVKDLCKYLFLSVEPQIGQVDLSKYLFPTPLVDWVIIGGESKQGKEDPRPFHIEWARFAMNQCRMAGVPCFIKQFGSIVYENGERVTFKDGHGGDMAEWAAELRVRECPEHFQKTVAA